MRIIIADDHRVVRDGLRWMLSDHPDIDVVGEAADGKELLELVATTPRRTSFSSTSACRR